MSKRAKNFLTTAAWLVACLASGAVVIENINYIRLNSGTLNALGPDDWWWYPLFIIMSMSGLLVYCLCKGVQSVKTLVGTSK